MTKFNMEKNYAEFSYRLSKKPAVATWVVAQKQYLKSFSKLCPRCGTMLPLDSKGCEGCLYQFNSIRRKNVK